MSMDPLHILLVEDNDDDVVLVDELLAEADAASVRLTTARTLASATAMVRTEPPDVLLLDLSLPDASGLEGVTALVKHERHVPIVILTGTDDEEVALEAMRAGAQDYLVKGQLNERVLIRSIRHAIERARTLRALHESEQRYALAVRGAHEVLWDWDLIDDSIYLSHRWQAIISGTPDETRLTSRDWLGHIHPSDAMEFERHVRRYLDGASAGLEHEHRVRSSSGGYVWLLTRGLAMRRRNGTPYRIVGSCRDITHRRRRDERLRHQALHDELTDLPNRALFGDLLRQAVSRTRRHPDHRFAVLVLDVDRFKVVNESLGHSAGDRLLVMVARRLEECLRPEDTVARLGGDEFAVLVDGIRGPSDAVRVANRVQSELTRAFELGPRETYTSASIGIAPSSTGYSGPEEILRDADIAMSRAKSSGKARYHVFDKKMHQQAVSLLHLETDLRGALERDELEVFYQPIVDLESRAIAGLEALVRWRHPSRGLLSPREFVPLAEETGLIVPLGQWVLSQACAQTRCWLDACPDHAGLDISVNISGRQLAEPALALDVERTLDASGLDPSRLRLEMTESVVMTNAARSQETLTQLRDLGVRLAIDDFGTGYSSLSYLHRFPVDTLKIDRSFVSALPQRENLEIVKSIVSIATNLRLDVSAEGVETEHQVELLRGVRCPRGQGFLFHHPLPAPEATRLFGAAA